MLILLLSYEGFVPNRIIYSPVNANSYTLPYPSSVRIEIEREGKRERKSVRALLEKSDLYRKLAGISSRIHVRHSDVSPR